MKEQFPPAAKPVSRRLVGAVVAVGAVVTVVAVVAMNGLKSPIYQTPHTAEATNEPVIEITDQGFVPNRLIVKGGATVRWVNKTQRPQQVASNPFPERTDLPGLYSEKPLAPGESYEYTFDRLGTWGFHDVTQPTMNGAVVVE